MKYDTSGLDFDALREALHLHYGVRPGGFEFIESGSTSYCFRVIEAGKPRHFLRVVDAASAAKLDAAQRALVGLGAGWGLAAAVTPYATAVGELTVPLGGYVLALFPYVGEETLWQRSVSAEEVRQAAVLLARLHDCDLVEPEGLFRETFVDEFRERILTALGAAEVRGEIERELQMATKGLLRAEREGIAALLARLEELGNQLRALRPELVLTHGDPNLANLVVDASGGVHLVDWDDIGFRPRESDLWAHSESRFDEFLRSYVAESGPVTLHPGAFAFYEYRWAAQEIADYTTRLLFRDQTPAEDAHAWAELQPYLPVPFARMEEAVGRIEATLITLGLV